MKKVVILGCTGSIGTTAIQAIRDKKMEVSVVGLSAHSNEKALFSLARELSCTSVCLTARKGHAQSDITVFDDLSDMLSNLEADIVLNGIAGFAGLEASLLSIQQGFDLALANKESIVCGGSYLFDLARHHDSKIIAVDSEHSALAELVKGRPPHEIGALILTGSGGPFRTLPIVNALIDDGKNLVAPLDFSNLSLTFEKPDYERFPLLALAFSILKRRGSAALAFNAADEVAVHTFLDRKCTYPQMIRAIEKTLEKPWDSAPSSFEETLALDAEARKLTRSYV